MDDKNISNQKVTRTYSLRQRYLFVSTIIVVLIFSASWLAQSYVSQSSELHQQGIEHRHQVRQYIRQLQVEVIQIEKVLEDFMWTPTQKLRDSVHHNIDRALHTYELLSRYEWSAQKKIEDILGDFAPDLKALHTTLDRVMDMRMEREAESPMQLEVEKRIGKATKQLNQLSKELRHGSYSLSLQVETSISLWANLYRQYALYSSKTSGNITEEQLVQKNKIEQLYKQLFSSLEKIAAHPQISTNAKRKQLISEIIESLSIWQLGYEVIKLERDNSSWRGDILFLQQTLAPQFEHLREYLQKLDITIDDYFKHDATILGEVANTIVGVVWLLSLLGLVVISVAYLYFRHTVLGPIATVATALKHEAAGEHVEAMPEVHNLETRHLIDAFDEMRRQVQDRQQALEHIAMHDGLTSLPNRHHIMQTLHTACQDGRQEYASFVVMMLGLDRFKDINDTLGQRTGDNILKNYGQRLCALLKGQGIVARFTSDEFVVLLPDTDREAAQILAWEVRNEMEHPFDIDGISLSVSCSIGLALFPENGDNNETLTRHATIAMTTAKQHKTGVSFYDERYDNASMEHISLAGMLRQALQSDGLHLYYQPQFSVHNQQLSGLEVLCRWDDPQHGFISPDKFIPVAEQSGQIHELTGWVIRTSLQQAKTWRGKGIDFGTLSVNISAFNLHASNFIPMLKQEMERWDFPASKLVLEITETAMMADPEHAIQTMEKLSQLGVKLSIDDYGTGFSSLAYVKQLPVDELKIDKSFVMDMSHNENDAVIVRSTIDLAHNLGLKVVAEGVDSREKQDLLEILNCDYMQGFHLGRPQSAEQLESLLTPKTDKRSKVRHIKDFR